MQDDHAPDAERVDGTLRVQVEEGTSDVADARAEEETCYAAVNQHLSW